MQTQIIGVKELIQNLKMIHKRVNEGEEFIVVKNSKPTFKIVPIEQQTKKNKSINNKPLVDQLKKIQFSGGKNLSNEIDNIVYSA